MGYEYHLVPIGLRNGVFHPKCRLLVGPVRDHTGVSKCDYCGSTAEEFTGDAAALIAAPLDSAIEIIAEELRSEWNHANDENIEYGSAEGGYPRKYKGYLRSRVGIRLSE